MAFKEFVLDEYLSVTVYKRKSNRNLRLSVTPAGQVRVSIPMWAPYRVGLDFARSRQQWISQQHPPKLLLRNGDAIGKAHHVRFMADAKAQRPSGRVNGTEVVVRYPPNMDITDPVVQAKAERAGIRALRAEAERLLPPRLANLAHRHQFTYKSVAIKRLQGRWGSCDQHGNIVLNLYLMQLPWECIDYVLLHELTHTRVMRHGPDFWQAMQPLVNDLTSIRRAMRAQQPVLRSVAA